MEEEVLPYLRQGRVAAGREGIEPTSKGQPSSSRRRLGCHSAAQRRLAHQCSVLAEGAIWVGLSPSCLDRPWTTARPPACRQKWSKAWRKSGM